MKGKNLTVMVVICAFILIAGGVVTARYLSDEKAEKQDATYEEFYSWNYEFDYDFYLKEFVGNGQEDGGIVIDPICFITEDEKDLLEKYSIDTSADLSYYVVNETVETVEIPLSPDTEFLVINWNHDTELLKNSINKDDEGLCVLKDAAYFYEYMRTQYGEGLENYPLFLELDENGAAKRIVELMLP